MKFQLKGYQTDATADVVEALHEGFARYEKSGKLTAVSLSAPTGAGKTVIATGITTPTELHAVARTGCEFAQGPVFMPSTPVNKTFFEPIETDQFGMTVDSPIMPVTWPNSAEEVVRQHGLTFINQKLLDQVKEAEEALYTQFFCETRYDAAEARRLTDAAIQKALDDA